MTNRASKENGYQLTFRLPIPFRILKKMLSYLEFLSQTKYETHACTDPLQLDISTTTRYLCQ